MQESLKRIEEIITGGKYEHVYMLGEIIHNEQVISELEKRGVRIIKDVHKIPEIPLNSVVIIQSHGVGPGVYEELERRNINYVDSTCILVKKIHRAIAKLEKDGYYPLIIGDPEHTEVIGISGYVENRPIIIENLEGIKPEIFKDKAKIGIVMQSTFFYDRAEAIIERIKDLVNEVKVVDTICKPTKDRQKEVALKSKSFKSVVVVGSKNSSNTKKLYHISKTNNRNTFLVSSVKDVAKYDFSNLFPIFLISGASSPISLVEDIKKEILNRNIPRSFYGFSNIYRGMVEYEIKEIFDRKFKQIEEKEIRSVLKALRDFCLRPGKRIRPLLLIWGYLAFGGSENDNNLKEVIKAAASVEMMHSFLLIHDDIMDNADIRRGGKSFHLLMDDLFSSFTNNPNVGRDIAITAGDMLFALSIEVVSELKIEWEKKNNFLRYFGNCYFLTGMGQIYDLLASMPVSLGGTQTSRSEKINILKTSYYTIYYPVLMGLALNGRGAGMEKMIESMAIPLGKAFQMRDDVISILGNSSETGKPDDSDIVEGKMTVLVEKTLDLLKGERLKKFKELFTEKEKSEYDVTEIRKMIVASGAVEVVRDEIESLFKSAKNALSRIKIEDNYKSILEDMISILSDF